MGFELNINRKQIDTRALGLDLSVAFSRFLTGHENLHYGYWSKGLDICAGNLGSAQDAYTTKLLSQLPNGRLRILDVGGGAGETARRLIAMGHDVDIVVPSEFLFERCQENAGPAARVHLTRFEDFDSNDKFDVCLFSESFQYVAIELSLRKAARLLAPNGVILISDCFRTAAFFEDFNEFGLVGGGHSISVFREAICACGLEVAFEKDITSKVAPSVQLEQGFYNVIGHVVNRIDDELTLAYPKTRWVLYRLFRFLVTKRRRLRLKRRLHECHRTVEAFCKYNIYLIIKLKPISVSNTTKYRH